MLGAPIQKETVVQEVNAPFYTATRVRYRTRLEQRDITLEVKDKACLPASRDLLDGDSMLVYGFDLRINGMTVGVEGFAGHCGGQVRRLAQCTVKGTAQQTLGIVQIE